MQRIFYEKVLLLEKEVQELDHLTVDEAINYKIESQGVRALGQLDIQGTYLDYSFKEIVDIDIQAGYDKIIDQRDFLIKVEDFDYHIQKRELKIMVTVGVHGVKDGEDKYIKDQRHPYEEIETLERQLEDNILEDHHLSHQEDQQDDYQDNDEDHSLSDEETIDNETSEPTYSETQYPIKDKDETNEDEDVGSYYLHVINSHDTYDSLANDFQIREAIVREYNHNESLEVGKVIIIPYVEDTH